ncbi:hypothetical protein CPC08DRAFT_379571 [Agrocybe pediades]|nr:hypothetical protein CPC08DRAFT_379571 [Agrocybe pediades]
MSFGETPLEHCLDSLDIQTNVIDTLKLNGAAALVSVMAFSMTMTLSFSCCRAITSPSTAYSNRRRRILLTYATYMSLICVASLITNIFNFLSNSYADTIAPIQTVLFMLALWGADGFMIWRCFMLYHDVHKAWRVLLICTLSILAIGSLAAGAFSFTLASNSDVPAIVLASFSILTNGILTCLIVGRVLYYQRSIRKHLGTVQGSLYSRAIALCVESCAIIVVFEIPFVVISFLGLGSPMETILAAVLPFIFILSALLLIYRVAGGQEVRFDHSTLQTMQFHRR